MCVDGMAAGRPANRGGKATGTMVEKADNSLCCKQLSAPVSIMAHLRHLLSRFPQPRHKRLLCEKLDLYRQAKLFLNKYWCHQHIYGMFQACYGENKLHVVNEEEEKQA